MKAHIEKAQSHLGELAGLASKTENAERRILEAAEKRLDEVQVAIEKARPGIEAAPEEKQDEYLALITERGQLNTVIAKARSTLGL